jgi:hypothetical protein
MTYGQAEELVKMLQADSAHTGEPKLTTRINPDADRQEDRYTVSVFQGSRGCEVLSVENYRKNRFLTRLNNGQRQTAWNVVAEAA